MDKKDIYEHLAKIYLDVSSKKRAKFKTQSRLRMPLFLGLSFILGFCLFWFSAASQKKSLNSQFTLLLAYNPVKINFNFDPACKETYSIDLNKLNLSRFKALGFSIKKTNYRDTISLRIEFANVFKEKSEIYIKNLPSKWGDYKISLSDFKNISDWSEMLSLSFIVEEWNTKENNGVIYIDNVGLIG